MVNIPTIAELRTAKAEIEKASAPLRAERDKVQQQIAELRLLEDHLTKQIHDIERPQLVELNQLLRPLEVKEIRRAAAQRATEAE